MLVVLNVSETIVSKSCMFDLSQRTVSREIRSLTEKWTFQVSSLCKDLGSCGWFSLRECGQ